MKQLLNSVKLMLIFGIFTFISCTKEVASEKIMYNNVSINDLREVLFFKYTSLENNRLVLTASDEFLIECGIDDTIINSFKTNLSMANKIIDDYVMETKTGGKNVNIRLADDIDELQTDIQIDSTVPHGMIDTRNGDVGEDYFFAPYNMLGVRCSIISAAPLAVHIVITHAMSDRQEMRVGMGDLVVPLAAANCYASIKYLTTDSNGGLCSWVGLLAGNN